MPTLQFKGKTFVQHHHLAVPYHQLVARPDLSLTDTHSLHDNLILRGDNLLALKALLPTYAGRIKCIYIDPPYNTGNEGWAYNDNLKAPMMREWLGKTVDRDDLTRHDKWCCMMMPRLKLLWELLRDDGAIFVSIDDNEQHHLRMLMDEVFGEENFVASLIWQHSIQGKGYSGTFSVHHNYILVYQKSETFSLGLLDRTEQDNINYSNPDNDPNGEWRTGDIRNALYRQKLKYDVTTPSGKIISPPANGWRFKEETMLKKIASGQVIFNGDESRLILKIYLKDVEGRVPETIWFGKEVGTTRDAKAVLKEIFEGEVPFDTPKPVELILKILKLSTAQKSSDIILDSFAGSGTTAHAVLALNQEDGGNRKFILVEMEDYADAVTAERVRRVMRGVPGAKNEALRAGLGGSFSFFDLGEAIRMEPILEGERLPAFAEMARYLFFNATGEQLTPTALRETDGYAGESRHYAVWLHYRPDPAWLRSHGFALDDALALPKPPEGKRNLVFAPMKFVDDDTLRELRIDFLQLPFEIYKMA